MRNDTAVGAAGDPAVVSSMFEFRDMTREQVAEIVSIKEDARQLAERIVRLRAPNPHVPRLANKALERLEEAVMWATKAVSRQ